MCLLVVWFMWSIIAASVVDLPEPVVPVSSTIPRSSSASSRTTSRQRELFDRADLVGNRAAGHRDRASLLEGVDAKARDPGKLEGEVDLVFGRELVKLGLVAKQIVQRSLGVRGVELGAVGGGQLAVDAEQRRRADLQVQIGSVPLHQLAQRLLHVEHTQASACRDGRA